MLWMGINVGIKLFYRFFSDISIIQISLIFQRYPQFHLGIFFFFLMDMADTIYIFRYLLPKHLSAPWRVIKETRSIYTSNSWCLNMVRHCAKKKKQRGACHVTLLSYIHISLIFFYRGLSHFYLLVRVIGVKLDYIYSYVTINFWINPSHI
jgi:hypothetical protein